MSILKYTVKYILLAVVVFVVVLGIGYLIVKQRDNTLTGSDKQIAETNEEEHVHLQSSDRPPPPGETKESGYWHDGHWHETSPPLVPQSVKRKQSTKLTTQKNSPLKQWTHGPHIGHVHPPKKTVPDPQDYGLSQEQINRTKKLLVSARWYEFGGDDRLFIYLKEELEKGKTMEEIGAQMDQERVAIYTSEMDTINAFKFVEAFPNYLISKYAPEFAERAVAENPDFLEGHLFLAQQEEDPTRAIETYRRIAEHPDVHSLLSASDTVTTFDSLGNLLVMDEPFDAIKYLKEANDLDPKSGLYGLSVAFQRLGDVKTAWVYLKKLQTYPHSAEVDLYVDAIEVGKPLIDPLPLKPAPSTEKKELSPKDWDALHKDTLDLDRLFPPDTEWVPRAKDEKIAPHQNIHPDAERARAAAAAAAAAAKQTQEYIQKQQERAQQELNDFLDFAQTVLNSNSPMDTNNFLLKDMEAFFKGGNPKFDPERIIRAFETFERFGAKDGIKHLQKSDPDVAAAVLQLLNEKRPTQPKK